jgi:hypothetical protein
MQFHVNNLKKLEQAKIGFSFILLHLIQIKQIMPKPTIIKNKAICLRCKTEIESKTVHDFVSCPCGKLSLDGGSGYYSRVLYSKITEWEDTSVYAKLGKWRLLHSELRFKFELAYIKLSGV